MTGHVGWFCYMQWCGRISYEKYHIWGDNSSKDTKAFYESRQIAKFPLSQEEWDTLTLDELAKKYPMPKLEATT